MCVFVVASVVMHIARQMTATGVSILYLLVLVAKKSSIVNHMRCLGFIAK